MNKRNRLTVLLLLPVLCTLFLSGLFLPISAQTQAEKEISLGGEDWNVSVPKTTNVYSLTKSLGQELRMYLDKPNGQNFVIFPLNYEGVKFYKQLPLDKELDVKEYDFVNATHAIIKEETVVYRPENIVNSYAVYSEKTGQKVAHIYRSAVFDSKGERQYVDMEITHAGIKVYLPTEWAYDASRYPLSVDPTIGYNAIGGSTTFSMGSLTVSPFNASESGYITSISYYAETPDIEIKVGVYNSSKILLLNNTLNTINGWQTININNIPFNSGTLWLGFIPQEYINYYYDSGGTLINETEYDYDVLEIPNPTWQKDGWNTNCYSIYLNYTTGEPGPTPTPTPTPTATDEPTSTPLPTNEEGYGVFELLLLTVILVVINIVGLGFRVPLLNLVALIFSFTFIIIFEVSNASILLIAINCLVSVACLAKNLYGRDK